MAITTEGSVQLTNQLAHPPVEMESNYIYGKLRVYRINFTQGAAAGDANSFARLIRLPAGKIMLLGTQCVLKISALGAARIVDIGWEAYRDKSGVVVAADPDGLVDGLVATAATYTIFSVPPSGVAGAGILADTTKTFESSSGVVLAAQCTGDTLPAGATMQGLIVVAVE